MSQNERFEPPAANFRSYIFGFGLSLLLSLAAYGLVAHHTSSRNVLLFAIFSLAIIQLITQLVFFLHFGRESKPRWNLLVFSFALIVLVILVSGSLWIMYNLNYHHGNGAHASDSYIIKDEGIKP
jgi:cytochrome o ubiquinol oxidase subunit IV